MQHTPYNNFPDDCTQYKLFKSKRRQTAFRPNVAVYIPEQIKKELEKREIIFTGHTYISFRKINC